MSKLIKRDEGQCFEIECFEADEIFEGHLNQPERKAGDQVTLPIGLDHTAMGAHGEKGASKAEALREKESTQDRLARLEREAYEKGFEQGRKDGLDLEKRQIDEKGKQFEALFQELSHLKNRLVTEAEGDILNLSLSIAKQIIRQESTTDSHIIINTIRSAIQFVSDNNRIEIILNPKDMQTVKKILPDLAELTKGGQFHLQEDRVIERGGCMIETGFGQINATLADQLWRIEKEIRQEFESSKGQQP